MRHPVLVLQMAAIAGQQLITLLGSDTRRGFSASVRSAQLGHALLEKPLIRTAFRFQSEIEPVVRQQFKVLQEQRQAMLNTAKEELRLNEDGWAELQAIKSRLADFNRYFDEVEVDTAAAFQELHGMYVQLYHDRLTASKPPTQQQTHAAGHEEGRGEEDGTGGQDTGFAMPESDSAGRIMMLHYESRIAKLEQEKADKETELRHLADQLRMSQDNVQLLRENEKRTSELRSLCVRRGIEACIEKHADYRGKRVRFDQVEGAWSHSDCWTDLVNSGSLEYTLKLDESTRPAEASSDRIRQALHGMYSRLSEPIHKRQDREVVELHTSSGSR